MLTARRSSLACYITLQLNSARTHVFHLALCKKELTKVVSPSSRRAVSFPQGCQKDVNCTAEVNCADHAYTRGDNTTP